jgi:hypothetical protein
MPDQRRPSDACATGSGLALYRCPNATKEFDMPLWDVLVSIFWFMILFMWAWLLITILGDLFRDHELSGWGKALWTLFLIVAPWLGTLVYLIARGRSMSERDRAEVQRNKRETGSYAREAAGPRSTADELAKLADLRDQSAISDEEFRYAKAKVLGREPGSAPLGPVNDGAVPSPT